MVLRIYFLGVIVGIVMTVTDVDCKFWRGIFLSIIWPFVAFVWLFFFVIKDWIF